MAQKQRSIPDLTWFSNGNYDGGRWGKGSITSAHKCSFRNADFTGCMSLDEATDCVFDGARLHKLRIGGPFPGEGGGERCSFQKADLSACLMADTKFAGCDFSGANLKSAWLDLSDLSGARFRGATLTAALLCGANLTKADLSDADLSGANLADADLRGARIDGVNFQGANLYRAKVAGLDFAKARNFSAEQCSVRGKIGAKLSELGKLVRASKKLVVEASVDVQGALIDLSIYTYGKKQCSPGYLPREGWVTTTEYQKTLPVDKFETALLHLATLWAHGQLLVDSVRVEAEKCPLKGDPLLQLAIEACCEAFGRSAGDGLDEHRQKNQHLREQMLADLRAGPAGIKRWNAVDHQERERVGSFRDLDLSGCNLAGAHFNHLDFQGSKFDRANLRKAELRGNLTGSSFRKADCAKANFASTDCSGVSFERANLGGAWLSPSIFQRASFKNADLRKANLSESDLCGADLTGAQLNGAQLEGVKYDERTRWPRGFRVPASLRWEGKGAQPLEFQGFLEQVAQCTKKARLTAALRLLRGEPLQLYGDLSLDGLQGVVQGEKEPAHACRLGADGTFTCCTVKLARCGDLQGAPCKHLLALVIGLAKANELEFNEIAGWLAAARKGEETPPQPLSELWKRYAPRNKADWQPTVTVPEDFQAL